MFTYSLLVYQVHKASFLPLPQSAMHWISRLGERWKCSPRLSPEARKIIQGRVGGRKTRSILKQTCDLTPTLLNHSPEAILLTWEPSRNPLLSTSLEAGLQTLVPAVDHEAALYLDSSPACTRTHPMTWKESSRGLGRSLTSCCVPGNSIVICRPKYRP